MKLKSAIKHHMTLTALVLIGIAIISYIGSVWWSFKAYQAYVDSELLKYPEPVRPYVDIFFSDTIYGRIACFATIALPLVIVAIIAEFAHMSKLNTQNKG